MPVVNQTCEVGRLVGLRDETTLVCPVSVLSRRQTLVSQPEDCAATVRRSRITGHLILMAGAGKNGYVGKDDPQPCHVPRQSQAGAALLMF